MTSQNPVLIDLPLPIHTPRLVIRPLMAGDGAAMNAAKNETWDELQPWMAWAKTRSTVEEDELVARQSYARFILREDMTMVACDRDTMEPVIFTGLHRFNWETRRMEIGFWRRTSARGKGLVTESTNALIRYAFAILQAQAVVIYHDDGNDASRRVIERLNLRHDGRVIAAERNNDGVVRDQLMYSTTDISALPDLDVHWGDK